MSDHYLDPRHGEVCPDCASCTEEEARSIREHGWGHDPSDVLDPDCPTCRGTGRRGGDAEAYIAVLELEPDPWSGKRRFAWRSSDMPAGNVKAPFPTADDALFAARCALAGVDVKQIDGNWCWRVLIPKRGIDRAWTLTDAPTATAALIAALDAKGGER